MAGTDGHPDPAVDAPPATAEQEAGALRAGFFETVRLLSADGPAVGTDAPPEAEPVRFAAAEGFRHPDAEMTGALQPPDGGAVRITAGFMGLTGPSGVMPDHYTDTLLARGRARDEAMGRFLDLFNHRALSLFYRAWSKYRLPVRFAETQGDLSDPFSRALAAIAGFGDAGDDPRRLAAAGPLSRRVRSPSALRRTLALQFDLPVEVRELQPRRIRVTPAEQTRVGGPATGRYARLGGSAVLGERVTDVAGRFRLRIGPLDRARFRAFFEAGGVRRRLSDAVRHAAGPTADFDLQLVLAREDVRPTRLDANDPARLGEDSWLLHGPAERDRDDAVLAGRMRAA